MSAGDPSTRLRVVIVNYNAGELLERAVRSVIEARWPGPKQIVVVDNASDDGSVAAVDELPGVTVFRNPTNDGFVAANLGFADLLGEQPPMALDPCDRLLLLNPDAAVAGDALVALGEAFGTASSVGAAAPHVVFDRPFVDIAVESGAVEIEAVAVGGTDVGSGVIPRGSAYRLPGTDGPLWLAAAGDSLRVPVAAAGPVEMSVRVDAPARVSGIDVHESGTVTVDTAGLARHVIVQNAGSEIGPFGVGRNRGFGDIDGSIDYPSRAPAWCGAAVMLDAAYVSDVGGFEPSFFLYYEDIDLAQRGQARGWITAYVPDARVDHRHSVSAGQGSRLVEVLQHRNRLLTVARNDTAGATVRAYARAVITPASLVASAARDRGDRRRARLRLARWRARALIDAVVALPAARRVQAAPRSG